MNQLYFKRIVNKIEYNFIPVYSVKDDSLLGYKIIKDFTPVGFDDKDFMYQMAYEEGVFEEFILELLEKAYKIAKEKKYDKYLLFYTLRMNYISNLKEFFSNINFIVERLEMDPSKLIFDIKHITNWYNFYRKIESVYHYKTILKENKGEKFNLVAIKDSKSMLLEFRVISHLIALRREIPENIKLIFNLGYDDKITIENLKKYNIDYYYRY